MTRYMVADSSGDPITAETFAWMTTAILCALSRGYAPGWRVVPVAGDVDAFRMTAADALEYESWSNSL